MSIIANNLLQGDEGYNISRSLRFRSSASAYLNRTPSTGNRKTWTWSGWVKRGQLGVRQSLLYCVTGTTDSTFLILGFDASERFEVSGYITQFRTSTAVYRDPSAWYHVVVAFDSTQATASNRLRVYINNTEITAWTTNNAFTQNTDYGINQNTNHQIGGGGYLPFDGYLTEVNFIDGQALTPSSFGETDLVTGVWKAKKYGGTYGTNGFYLPFSDNTSTTTLGYDKSGNSNNWTTNNISLTAGSTYDSMVDVPTMSALGSNYAVLNPLWVLGSNGTLSDGNLTDAGGGNPAKCFPATIAVKGSGKFYAEFQLTGGANYSQLAVIDISSFATSGGGIKGSGQISWDTNSIGSIYYINSTSASGTPPTTTTNDVVMVAFDANTRNVWFGKNGTWNNSSDPATATSPVGAVSGSSDLTFAIRAESTTIVANFGQRPFSYTPPTGFVALNVFNLPEPSIKQGNKHFDATTYTGTGSSLAVTNSGGFQPDLVWVKARNLGTSHNIVDAVRGVSKNLKSNSTGAEGTGVDGATSAFNSNGFTVSAGAETNASTYQYVGWQWKANGTGSSNTAGSITSTVSANPTAGFSVVTYTGTGANATVGHGLGVAPKMILSKNRTSGSSNWNSYHASVGATACVVLNTTSAPATGSTFFQNTAPTSSVYSLGSDASLNTSGNNHVAYCFSEINGYSKISSYVGNGNADGTFVYCGFRPRWLLLKEINATSGRNSWFIIDSARNSINIMNSRLGANLSDAEASDIGILDFVSNGFKLRNSNWGWNESGATYIFACFAESPFKTSLAR